MSEVLNRMVQRSRGQLPAIQPLVRAPQTAAAALLFMEEEIAGVAAPRRDTASAGRARALREEPAAPMRDNPRRDIAQTSERKQKVLRGSDALDVDRAGRTTERGGAHAEKRADEEGLKSAQGGLPVEVDAAAQENTGTYERSRDVRAKKPGAEAKSEEMAGEKIRAEAETGRSAEKQDALMGRNVMHEAAIDAAEHTEIHITIGSVELRVPRAAPVPPKTPAFRPQVTLDEYLKRGSGSGRWGGNR
jgi:hypothetical protein